MTLISHRPDERASGEPSHGLSFPEGGGGRRSQITDITEIVSEHEWNGWNGYLLFR